MDRITEEIAQHLTIDMIPDGIWKAVAEAIGTVNLIRLLTIANGDNVYIPRPDRLLVPARDACLLAEYNGYNHISLAGKYGLSSGYAKKLCNRPISK